MAGKGHLKQLVVAVLLKIWAHEQLDQSVVGACRYEPLRARPIHAVDAANVMVLLLKDHIDWLDGITIVANAPT